MNKSIYVNASLLGFALLFESIGAASGTLMGYAGKTPFLRRDCSFNAYGTISRTFVADCGTTLEVDLALPVKDSLDSHSVDVKVLGTSAAGSEDISAQYLTCDQQLNNIHATSVTFPPSSNYSYQTIGWTSHTPNDYHFVAVWLTAQSELQYVRWWASET